MRAASVQASEVWAKEDSEGWRELEERRSSEFKTRQVSGIENTALGPRGE